MRPTPHSVDPPLAIEARKQTLGTVDPPLGVEALKNATYSIEGDDVALKNGSWRSDNGSSASVVGIEKWALGDLDGNESQDAAVVLEQAGAGNGIGLFLIPVINNSGIAKPLKAIELCGECEVKGIKIQNEVVSIQLLHDGPNDPRVVQRY